MAKPFYLGATEVTQAQWRRILGPERERPGFFPGEDMPADGSWDDLQAILAAANDSLPEGVAPMRAPTEAEWEYACRAGTTGPYNFDGRIRHSLVNFNDGVVASPYADGELKVVDGELVVVWETLPSLGIRMAPSPAGSLPPNAWGLHEMHGNVAEYLDDKFEADGYAARGPLVVDPFTPGSGDEYRVLRGGDWYKSARFNRSARREGTGPNNRSNRLGFRVARTL